MLRNVGACSELATSNISKVSHSDQTTQSLLSEWLERKAKTMCMWVRNALCQLLVTSIYFVPLLVMVVDTTSNHVGTEGNAEELTVKDAEQN